MSSTLQDPSTFSPTIFLSFLNYEKKCLQVYINVIRKVRFALDATLAYTISFICPYTIQFICS